MGWGLILARDAVGTGFYFSAYETLKYLLSGTGVPGPITYAISGAFCGVVAWCLVFPIDTARVRILLLIILFQISISQNPLPFEFSAFFQSTWF